MAQKSELGETCKNCDKPGHTKPECWLKGGGMEGQGTKPKRSKRGRKGKESATVAKEEEDELFAFTCTSDYTAEAKALKIPNKKCRVCLDSGASNQYCPDHDKFESYRPLAGCDITMANGHKLKAMGIGDVHIKLPNGSKPTCSMLKSTIHTPEMAFTLISIGCLDKVNCQVIFREGACTIHNLNSQTMAIVPHNDGLYQFEHEGSDHANVTTEKMSISKAHHRLGHIHQ